MRWQSLYRALSAILIWALGLGSVDTAAGAQLAAPPTAVHFNQLIRPILSEHCFRCHGPDAGQRQADLRLDLRTAVVGQADAPGAIVPGAPESSELLRRIVALDPDVRMPPVDQGRPLSAEQIETIRQWIQEGASYEEHWAYQPIQSVVVPPSDDPDMTDIDRFLAARLQDHGLSFSAPVDKTTWIRRASFDLLGLPPTWEEVVAFVNDASPDAYQRVIDRLLDSPRYGERWGRYWLDIARYADTHGGGAIGFTKFPFSYTYRDYVISALNRDLPYNEFIVEQIAADQLQERAGGIAPGNNASLAALGFLTVGRQYRNPHDLIDDRIDVITRGILGLTVACARCHDHKYDAIPTDDYYALYATFAPSRSPEELPILGRPPDGADFQQYRQELDRRQENRRDVAREQSEVMRSRLRMQVGLYLRELAQGAREQDLSSIFLSYRTDDVRPLVLERWRRYLNQLSDQDPVFGPWRQLSRLPADILVHDSESLIRQWNDENGDLSKRPQQQSLASQPTRWNTRVLEALAAHPLTSMLDVADAYGGLFADVQRQWLQAQIEATVEAAPGAQVIPDEDPRHLVINSAELRQLRRHLYAPDTPTAMPDEIAVGQLNRPIHDHVRGLENSIHDLHLNSPGSPPRAMVLREEPLSEDFFVFRRGNPIDRGQLIKPRFLTALSPTDTQTFPDGQRRLGLAQALVDPVNPLTRRVIVNWVWSHHFGRGLVRTPDDFGVRGEPPTHPQLLDYLASVLLDDDWSLKALHRRIMLTQAYRQTAREDAAARQLDPENFLLWRMPRRRIDLEAMRDAMLSVSGQLDLTMGGRPFELFSEPGTPRRTVYGFVNRDVIPGFASTFDMADPSACTARRPETTVPQQTLFALNSHFIQQQAQCLANLESVRRAPNDLQRVRELYRRAFSRDPRQQEIDRALDFIRSHNDPFSAVAWQRLTHALLAANEFVFVD